MGGASEQEVEVLEVMLAQSAIELEHAVSSSLRLMQLLYILVCMLNIFRPEKRDN